MADEMRLFWRRIRLGIWVAPLALIVGYWPAIGETRLARDLLLRTPFLAVAVTESQVLPRGIKVSGHMVKRRCDYRALSAYVLSGDRWRRALIDTSPEDAVAPGGNRPPGSQSWGPWLIEVRGGVVPTAWRIFAHHLCPEDRGVAQVNLFAQGEWRDAQR
ncbi:hypothetical protein ACEYYA_00990 [Paracoccus sp. p3-h83]|uniref:hypothetical protein n=1 Tax=Paracoccus sp. p3-h83 TaxID=3342805 RepID=UPI0035BB6DE0